MKKLYWMGTTAILIILSTLILSKTVPMNRPLMERRFEFTYQTDITDIPSGTERMDIWIPYPTSDENQEISHMEIKSPYQATVTKDPVYGNSMLYIGLDHPPSATASLSMKFQVNRRENLRKINESLSEKKPEAQLGRFLQSDNLMPVDGKIKKLAMEITLEKPTPPARARAIYDYTVANVKYDKSGSGWGRGDILYACDIKKGNCSDFHAMFVGFCRAVGIPAKFEIGFPLPEQRGRGEIGGYHCWAQFYLSLKGWIPVDCSEASKNPSKKEYFFGAHDENRVLFSTGRDIQLEPPQKGKPLNFFIYPYVEVDGKPYEKVSKKFTYADLK
ncbi:MAG: transglutaminase domain-containing protein [Acidobacteria bacterium]|nr:transglutaminase domain-containing protein [Acidobacteriota bacterium]MBI3655330.1 transglutaminase domain-containing protein [Acidobacteriota bacterium]